MSYFSNYSYLVRTCLDIVICSSKGKRWHKPYLSTKQNTIFYEESCTGLPYIANDCDITKAYMASPRTYSFCSFL